MPMSEPHRVNSTVSRFKSAGWPIHVHILARNGREIALAEWVKELKRVSSRWIKTQGAALKDFEWQRGYAVFSVSQSNPDQVRAYIAD